MLERMTAALAHRGPDGEAIWTADEIGLGMRRLAIVDVEHGEQPVVNEDQTIRVVFNGEIYNHGELRQWLDRRGHRMRSRMDGEVIPHLYEELGPACFARLDGIFAIALWDANTRRLLLARDHLGVKPLYVHRGGEVSRFASELKSLLKDPAVPRRLDLEALDAHLTFRFTPAPRTLLEGVEKLEPATCLVISDSGEERFRYWNPAPKLRRSMPLPEAADRFQDLLRAAVRRQMMSDRPIGAMLSGGIDSGAVVAMMSEVSDQVRTFTVGFEGGGDADETKLARQTARLFDTDHHDIVLPPGDFREDLPAAIEALEEPVGTSSAIGFREVARMARREVPVLLSGQGADEVLGGYWRYVGEWMTERLLGFVAPLRLQRPLAAVGARVPSARLERGLRALRFPETSERFMQIYAVFDPQTKASLYGRELAAAVTDACPEAAVERYRAGAAEAGRDALDQMMYVDTRLWLPDDLLLVGDKMSMAESVEMRVPFLDRGLVEFTESLPSSYKVRRGMRKVLEKRALADMLPREIVHRKERGFVTPVDRWLRGPELHGYAREILLDRGGQISALFDSRFVDALLRRHASGSADHTRQLYCLMALELWGRRFLGSSS